MLNREELRRAAPSVETATTKYVSGEITQSEYEDRIVSERASDQAPPGEETT